MSIGECRSSEEKCMTYSSKKEKCHHKERVSYLPTMRVDFG
jgi:hypothetical protein